MSGNAFFDTNLLVYAHDVSDPAKMSRCRSLLFKAMQDGTAVLSPQVLGEFYVTVTRKTRTRLSLPEAREELELLSSLCTVDLDASLVCAAAALQDQKQISYWDALIIVSAQRAGCDILYSEDLSHGQIFGSLKVVNPFLD